MAAGTGKKCEQAPVGELLLSQAVPTVSAAADTRRTVARIQGVGDKADIHERRSDDCLEVAREAPLALVEALNQLGDGCLRTVCLPVSSHEETAAERNTLRRGGRESAARRGKLGSRSHREHHSSKLRNSNEKLCTVRMGDDLELVLLASRRVGYHLQFMKTHTILGMGQDRTAAAARLNQQYYFGIITSGSLMLFLRVVASQEILRRRGAFCREAPCTGAKLWRRTIAMAYSDARSAAYYASWESNYHRRVLQSADPARMAVARRRWGAAERRHSDATHLDAPPRALRPRVAHGQR